MIWVKDEDIVIWPRLQCLSTPTLGSSSQQHIIHCRFGKVCPCIIFGHTMVNLKFIELVNGKHTGSHLYFSKISLGTNSRQDHVAVDHWISFLGKDCLGYQQCHLSYKWEWICIAKSCTVVNQNLLVKLTWKLLSFRPEFHGYAGSVKQTGFWKCWLCLWKFFDYLIGMTDISLMAVVHPPIWSSNQYSPILGPIVVRYFARHKMPLSKCYGKYQNCQNGLHCQNQVLPLHWYDV